MSPTESRTTLPTGALPCPFCHTPIPVLPAALLAGQPLHCPQCQAVLTVNTGESAEALEELAHWQADMAAARQRTTPEADSPVMIPRRRRPRRERS